MKPIYVRVPRTASGVFVQLHGHEVTMAVGHPPAWRLRTMYPEWDEAHTFGFIRNPWDWLVSIFSSGMDVSAGPKPEPVVPDFSEWVKGRTTPIDWLSDLDGNVIVDEVRTMEEFLTTIPIGTPWIHADPHPPRQEMFDDDLAAFVAEKCAREIELGGYEF